MEELAGSQLYTIVPEGSITTPQGFSAGGLHSGLKKSTRHDLGAIVCSVPATAAGVYTLNAFQAAPIKVTKQSIGSSGLLRAVVVNSGNANACTGEQGEQDAFEMRNHFAKVMELPQEQVAVASTGVIGELLKMDKLIGGIDQLPAHLGEDKAAADHFCQAILTTDLVQKMVCVQVELDGQVVHIAGAAKGSGMIAPNMATMLGFVTTDAKIDSAALEQVLRQVTDLSFNMITVDGDTSTNDMLVAMASGLAGNESLTAAHPQWEKFVAGLRHVCEYLAKAIARDGEGATKLVEVQVQGAVSNESARAIAKTIVGSSLVKSAMFGADANWGRIIAAIGRAGEPVQVDTVDIALGSIETLKQSRPVSFDEEAALEYLKGDTIVIHVDLHMADGQGKAWGCDLTYDYVRINAAYRT